MILVGGSIDIGANIGNFIRVGFNPNRYDILYNGVCVGEFCLEYSYYDTNDVYFSNFRIYKKHRGNGYSKLLLLYLIANIKDYNNLVLYCFTDNEVAKKLYESVGFKIDIKEENHPQLYYTYQL